MLILSASIGAVVHSERINNLIFASSVLYISWVHLWATVQSKLFLVFGYLKVEDPGEQESLEQHTYSDDDKSTGRTANHYSGNKNSLSAAVLIKQPWLGVRRTKHPVAKFGVSISDSFCASLISPQKNPSSVRCWLCELRSPRWNSVRGTDSRGSVPRFLHI